MVVFPSPVLQDHSGLGQCPELLPIQALIAEPGVEALDVAVLLWAAWVDVEGFDAVFCQPSAKLLLDELGAVVAADVLRGPALFNEPGDDLAHLMGVDLAVHVDAEAFPGVFIHDVEHPKLSAAHGGVMDEVPAPYVVAVGC